MRILLIFLSFSMFSFGSENYVSETELLRQNNVNPGYPRRAQEKEIMGYAIVTFSVNKEGKVFNLKDKNVKSFCTKDNPYDQDARFKECSTFKNNAIRAARKLKYFPKFINDEPIDVHNVEHKFTYLIENEITKDYLDNLRLAAREDEEELKIKQKEIILAGLIRRCEGFGWSNDVDIASCVQQEAYRDLQLEKQNYQIRMLEQKLASAQMVNDEPLFLSLLNMYADSMKQENINQIKKDIAILKTKSAYSYDNAEAALKSLYRTNN